MCGIIGLVGRVPEGCWGQTHGIIENLYRHVEHRGRDATGFVAKAVPYDFPSRATVFSEKQPVTASCFTAGNAKFRALRHRRCTSFVGHVRAATHGCPEDNRNNHPFVSDNRKLFVVHNGVLSNHADVAENYSLELRSECDSEVLLRLIETAPDVTAGLQDCLKLVKGSMAIAVYDASHDAVWLAHNGGRPLWLARLQNDRRWFFASTETILLKAFQDSLGRTSPRRLAYLAPVPECVPLSLTPDGRVLTDLKL